MGPRAKASRRHHCCHDVQHICREPFCDVQGAPGKSMRPVVEEILGRAHIVSAKGMIKRSGCCRL